MTGFSMCLFRHTMRAKCPNTELIKENHLVYYWQICVRHFDCLSHEFLVAKLHAYGFSVAALRLIHSYLTKRKQRTKVNLSYSPWETSSFVWCNKGSILGPLPLNIFLCDLFFKMNETDFAIYADHNTPYRTANTIDEVIQSLEHDSMMLFQWFSDN